MTILIKLLQPILIVRLFFCLFDDRNCGERIVCQTPTLKISSDIEIGRQQFTTVVLFYCTLLDL